MKPTSKTKVLALLLALCLVLGGLPLTAWAGDGTPDSGAAPGAGGTITAFASLDTEVSAQTVETGTAEDELNLPASLTAMAADREGRESAVALAVYDWDSAPAYDWDTAGDYVFTPALDLPEGLTVAEVATPPTITVTVEEAATPMLRGMAGPLDAGAPSYDYVINLADIKTDADTAIDGYTVNNGGAGPLLSINQANKSYRVYGTTDFYGLAIWADNISLTLDNTSIAMTGWDAAIDLHSDLDLTLAGTNSLAGQSGGIDGGNNYDLTIGGTGSVSTTVSLGVITSGVKDFTLNGGTVNGRIGADTIIINGGAVNAAALGWDTDALVAGSGVTISGGTLDVSAENGYGIDAGSGSVTISGGSVNASGGFEATSPQPTDGGGTTLYKTMLGGLPADTEITGLTAPAGYGSADMKTDAEGWLYLWLPEGSQNIAFTAETVNVDKTFPIAADNNNRFAAVDVTANVDDAVALKAALENQVPSTVNVTTDITLDSQITMGVSHTLTIPGGKTVTASGSGRIDLEAYTLTINGGGTLVSQKAGGHALRGDSGTLNLANITVQLKNTSSNGISVKTVNVDSGATIVLDSGHARNLISLSSGYTCTVNTGGTIAIQDFWDDGLKMEGGGTLHINGGTVTVGAGQSWNRGINAGSGGTLKYTSGTLNGTAGGMILLAEGAQAEGLNGKFRDRGTAFAATGQITVGATDAAASADGLTRGRYYWNGSQFVKEAIAIQTQPQDVTVTQGTISGSLTVSATTSHSAAVSYQWWETNEGGWSSSLVAGATGSAFPIPTGLAAGTYYLLLLRSQRRRMRGGQ